MNLSEQIHELNLETSSILREIGNNLGIFKKNQKSIDFNWIQ